MIAEVQLWGRTIGAVSWDAERGYATFQYDRPFLESGIEVAPITMPLSDRIYSFPALPEKTFYGLPGLLADSLAERGLLFQDSVTAQLTDYDPEADEATQLQYLETLHTRIQTTDLPQKLQVIPEKSPDLLGVILKEGKV